MLCTEKNVLGSDYETPLDAGQSGGQLEFTCLPLECDTMWTCMGCANDSWAILSWQLMF